MSLQAVREVRRGWSVADAGVDPVTLTCIQVARGMEYDGHWLSLVELAPVVPVVAGGEMPVLAHLSTGAFLDLWDQSGDDEPRTCVLSLVDPSVAPFDDAVLLVGRPRIHSTGLRYDATVVSGSLPTISGACVLYVNARGRSERAGSS